MSDPTKVTVTKLGAGNRIIILQNGQTVGDVIQVAYGSIPDGYSVALNGQPCDLDQTLNSEDSIYLAPKTGAGTIR